MPSHDRTSRSASEELLSIARERASFRAMITRIGKKRRRKPGDGGEALPVEPNRLDTRSGGAAAAVEFDD